MSNYTPGPWKWGEDWNSGTTDKYMDFQLLGADGSSIIPIRVDHYDPIWDSDPMDSWAGMTSDADRNLIASAPDLLEALWVAVEHNALHFGETHNTVIEGRKALAKARGENNVRY